MDKALETTCILHHPVILHWGNNNRRNSSQKEFVMLSELGPQNRESPCMCKQLCMRALLMAEEMPRRILFVPENRTLQSTMRHQRQAIMCQILLQALKIMNLKYNHRELCQTDETMSQSRAVKDNLL